MPALLTLVPMNLQAVYIADIKRVKSPVASLTDCCFETKYLVSVTGDDESIIYIYVIIDHKADTSLLNTDLNCFNSAPPVT